jgi:ParB/RepB/Spo0J family partition protein
MTTFATAKRPAEKQVAEQDLPTKSLEPHPLNPRLDADKNVDELAASIDDIGLIARVVVRPMPDGGYQILAGDRRWRAYKKAGRKTIPCVVRGDLDDEQALVLMARENIDREELNILEQGRAYHNLVAPKNKGGLGLKVIDVAKRFGIPPATIAVLTGALELPAEWQERIAEDGLSFTAVKALVRVADDRQVLAECGRDYEAQPWAWRSAKDFERSVETVRAKLRGGKPERPADDKPIVAPSRPKTETQPAAPAESDEPHADEEPVSVGRGSTKPAPRPLPIPHESAAIAHGDKGETSAATGDRFADLRDNEFFALLAPFLGDRRALEAIGNLALRLAVRTGGAR